MVCLPSVDGALVLLEEVANFCIRGAKAAELRASQAKERDSREKFQSGTDREVKQREDTIAKLNERLKELDKSDNPFTAQASRNLIDGEIMRLQGEIMQLQKNAETRKRQ